MADSTQKVDLNLKINFSDKIVSILKAIVTLFIEFSED